MDLIFAIAEPAGKQGSPHSHFKSVLRNFIGR